MVVSRGCFVPCPESVIGLGSCSWHSPVLSPSLGCVAGDAVCPGPGCPCHLPIVLLLVSWALLQCQRSSSCHGWHCQYSLASPKISWHSLAFLGIPWHSLEFPGIPWHFLVFPGIPWKCKRAIQDSPPCSRSCEGQSPGIFS